MTFELGAGFSFFAEGAYMLRNIQSIEWDTDSALPRLPHSANLRGPALAFGMQFNFRDPDQD